MRWAVRYGYGGVGGLAGRGADHASASARRASPASRRSATRGRCYAHFHDGLDIAAPVGHAGPGHGGGAGHPRGTRGGRRGRGR